MSNIPDKSGSPATKPKKSRHRESQSSDWAFSLVMAVALATMMMSFQISRALAHLGPTTDQVSLGKVVKVSFLSGIGHTTQVDTEKGSFLLWGAVNLEVGASLEQRRHWWDLEVCELRSGECWELVSR